MTSDGFLRTGDIAVMDERGYFRIVDRKKDMIDVSGLKVYPNEVEAAITHHPAVLEAACIGVPDERTGEAVKLFLALQPGPEPDGGRGPRLPAGIARALQDSPARRVPGLAAEVERRQDPAPGTARPRGNPRYAVGAASAATLSLLALRCPRDAARFHAGKSAP